MGAGGHGPGPGAGARHGSRAMAGEQAVGVLAFTRSRREHEGEGSDHAGA